MAHKKINKNSNVEGARSSFKNSFAPNTVAPATEAPYAERAPAGYYELAGSYGFDISTGSDFSVSAFISWVETNSSVLDNWLTAISGGDWRAGKMGSLSKNAAFGSPAYPFQVAPPSSLSTAQQTYNTNAIAAMYNIYTSTLPNISSATIRSFTGTTVLKVAIIGNAIAAVNVVAYQVFNAAGLSLNPADGYLDGLASAYVAAVSPTAWAALVSEIATLSAQETAAANASSKQTLAGLFKFAGTAIAAIATAGLLTPAIAATLKGAGSAASSLSANPALAGTTVGTELSEAGQALNPSLLTKLQTFIAANPNAGIFIVIGVIILVIIIAIAMSKSKTSSPIITTT